MLGSATRGSLKQLAGRRVRLTNVKRWRSKGSKLRYGVRTCIRKALAYVPPVLIEANLATR